MPTHPRKYVLRVLSLLFSLGLGACAAGPSTPAQARAPLHIESVSTAVSPASYSGPCGASQRLTWSATLSANANNIGGSVHYVWMIEQTPVQGDVTFAPGETSKTVTTAVGYTVPLDADTEVRASFATTTPNSVTSSDAIFRLACTVPFQVVDVKVTMQPWSSDCGPHTFGWAAVITAPANSVGGTVHYVWRFRVGATQEGSVTFVPGQITQVVSATQTYNVVPARSASNGVSPFPVVTPDEIYGSLSIDAPNSMSDAAVQDRTTCTAGG